MKKLAILFLLLCASSALAQHGDGSAYTPGPAWHWLQDIYAADGGVKLDSDNDGIADKANNLQVNSTGTARLFSIVGSSVILNMDGVAGQYTAIDFSDGAGGGWGIGRAPSGSFYIDRTGVGNAITINSANRFVGIGTDTPTQRLSVQGNAMISGELRSNGTGTGQARFVRDGYGLIQRVANANYYLLITNEFDEYGNWNALRPMRVNLSTGNVHMGGNALNVLHGGNVGIGITNPTERLHVSGNVLTTGSITSGADVCITAGNCLSTVSSAADDDWLANGNNIYNKNTGNVGIGTGAAPIPTKLTVAGQISASDPTGAVASHVVTQGFGDGRYVNEGQGNSISTTMISNNAVTLNKIDTSQVQARITGNCNGQVMVRINADGTVACEADDAGAGSETDPQVGTLNAGQWCRSDGAAVQCDQVAPSFSEIDPQVGSVNANQWCRGDGTAVQCNQPQPVMAEIDPQVGTVNNGQWCVGSGGQVVCNQAAPASGAVTCGWNGCVTPPGLTCSHGCNSVIGTWIVCCSGGAVTSITPTTVCGDCYVP